MREAFEDEQIICFKRICLTRETGVNLSVVDNMCSKYGLQDDAVTKINRKQTVQIRQIRGLVREVQASSEISVPYRDVPVRA